MDRKEVIAFLQGEIKRLREEIHINKLIKKKRFYTLSKVEAITNEDVEDFIRADCLMLNDKEIPEGGCAAVVVWLACCKNDKDEYFFEDKEQFAHRLAREAGPFGKNVAVQMLTGTNICEMLKQQLYTDKYAKEYDDKYGTAN